MSNNCWRLRSGCKEKENFTYLAGSYGLYNNDAGRCYSRLLFWQKKPQNEVGNLSFRDRFGILLKKRLGGVVELRYTMLYGKYWLKVDFEM